MRESDLLDHIYRMTHAMGVQTPHVLIGPGDDAAVVRTPQGDALVLSVDQVIEGRHYAPDTSIDLIARKAVARSISDLAAMGAQPFVGLAAGALPRGFEQGERLVEELHRWGRHWDLPLVGGDIALTDGPLTISVTALGLCPADASGRTQGPYLRSTARVGDDVFVTGTLGGSMASGWHLNFEPRLHEAILIGEQLGKHLHAMIDLSDGLGRDAARIGEASGVLVELDAAALPLRNDALTWRDGARDGEDYELLLTAGKDRPFDPPLTTRIGRVIAAASESPGCVIVADGVRQRADAMGWEHAE